MSLDDKLPAAFQAADSPFLEGTSIQFAWDSVSLTSILACPRQYQYRIVEGLVPKSPSYAIALVFGILFHKGLEIYHKTRAEPQDHDAALFNAVNEILLNPATATLPTDDRIDEMAEAHDPDEDDGITLRNSKIRTRYHLIRALVWYLDNYAEDNLHTIHLPSGAPAAELSFRLPLDIEIPGTSTPILLCGHIDRGVEFNDFLYVSDYKTTKSITSQWKDMFDLSHQMSGYILAGGAIFDKPVKGCIVDGIALQVGQVKFGRHTVDKSPGQITEYLDTLTYAVTKAVRHFEAGVYPQNTSACYFCEYKAICRTPPEFRERFITTYYRRQPGWNPLENR